MSNRFILPLSANLSVSHIVFNDTMITLQEQENGYAITAKRGSDVQEIIIPKAQCDCQGKPQFGFDAETAPQYAGHLLYVAEDGSIAPLALGDGLEIVDGKLTVTGAAARAICGDAVCGEVICGAT